jgi:hypothetical protein
MDAGDEAHDFIAGGVARRDGAGPTTTGESPEKFALYARTRGNRSTTVVPLSRVERMRMAPP